MPPPAKAPAVKSAKSHAMKDGIIKRGATYSYVIREKDPETGKTKPRWYGGFSTAKAAKQARDDARSASNKGTHVVRRDVTVGEWLDAWLEAHSVELKPSTVHSYRSKIDSYLKPALGMDKLQELSPMRLSVVFAELQKGGGKGGAALSARSVQYARSILRKALNDAVVERVIPINPVVGSKAPRGVKPKHVTWTGQQQRAFLAGVESSRWVMVWTLALATGMRRGELCALDWAHVSLETGHVVVERSATQIGQEVVTTDTKNHENRTIAIDPQTLAALRAWRKMQAAERLQWGPAYANETDLVFTWEDGSRVLPDYLTKTFVTEQRGLGLPRLTLHGTRHTHATTLLREGVPVHIVSKRLGHKDPSVTLNVYADAIPKDDDRAVEVFAKAVWGA